MLSYWSSIVRVDIFPHASRVHLLMFCFEASRLGRRPKRLKELQDALAQQRQAKENMATMHYAPLKPSSLSLTDLQVDFPSLCGISIIIFPVFHYEF